MPGSIAGLFMPSFQAELGSVVPLGDLDTVISVCLVCVCVCVTVCVCVRCCVVLSAGAMCILADMSSLALSWPCLL